MINRKQKTIASTTILLLFATMIPAQEDRSDPPFVIGETLRSFKEHVDKNPAVDAKTKSFLNKTWNDRVADEDLDGFIVDALAVLSPDFLNGLDQYEDSQYDKSFETMSKLTEAPDPYLSANANVFVVKSLIEQDKLDIASQKLESFLADLTAVDLYTRFAAEMSYTRAYLSLQELEFEQAERLFLEMLVRFPDASSRLRISAQQILVELKGRKPESIDEVADLMVYAGRRLSHLETGQPVQTRQQRAIELLDKLIEEAEQQEQSGSSGSGSGGSSGGQSQGPSSPMPDSALPGGQTGETYLRDKRTAKPGESWGTMPPAEREKILQALRDSFPSRYRQLVEQYYQELSKQP